MGKMKRKYESGAATTYLSRNKAIKKLQLTLADFRRLCILKGIYPVEPKHKKTVNRGSTAPKTYYHIKDIQFLLHEPLINKFREFKHYNRRLKKAVAKRNKNASDRIRASKPTYTLHNIVKERYPYFSDALRDLDDCLTLCGTFANFPVTRRTQLRLIHGCSRLMVEFQHYVIASHSLRKVFFSIKGIYYQADIQGETVTWIVPHKYGHDHPVDVDYKIMSTFVEFYVTMLSFVNYKLYSNMNLVYPPKLTLKLDEDGDEERLTRDEKDERVEALTHTLMSSAGEVIDDDAQPDDFSNPDDPDNLDNMEKVKVQDLQGLFKGLKFFLSREVPRECFTFIIRSFGGQVSWDTAVCPGATFQESDESITHQIVDRPKLSTQHFSRCYVQPQWVLDSVNARQLLPTKDYFVGAVLPPHLSPFVEEQDGDYMPPEKVKLLRRLQQQETEENEPEEEEEESEEDEGIEESAGESSEEEAEEESEKPKSKQKKRKLQKETDASAKKMKRDVVEVGKVEHVDVTRQKAKQEAEEKRLAELMIPKKNRRLYHKINYKKKKTTQEAQKLRDKREAIDKASKKEKKKQKKQSV